MENGDAKTGVNVLQRIGFVMAIHIMIMTIDVWMDQMRILQSVLSGTVLLDTGNARMACSVWKRARSVMEICGARDLDARMDQMKILYCVLSGTAVSDTGSVRTCSAA